MLKTFLAILAIVAASVVALSVRLFFGKRFVHTDIKGNRALERRGIHCVMEEETQSLSNCKQNNK